MKYPIDICQRCALKHLEASLAWGIRSNELSGGQEIHLHESGIATARAFIYACEALSGYDRLSLIRGWLSIAEATTPRPQIAEQLRRVRHINEAHRARALYWLMTRWYGAAVTAYYIAYAHRQEAIGEGNMRVEAPELIRDVVDIDWINKYKELYELT